MKETVIESPLGLLQIKYENGLLYGLSYVQDMLPADCPDLFSKKVSTELSEYFVGARRVFSVPCRLTGTAFQKKVWELISQIPYGSTVTYGEIAEKLGSKKAARAVGAACAKNPVMILVPCHRVTGGKDPYAYAGGERRKRRLLQLEKEGQIF